MYSPSYRSLRRSSWRDPSPALRMLRPNTLETPVAVEPRDCVVQYQVGPDKVLMVSYFKDGGDYEQFQTDNAGANERAEQALLARMRAKDARRDADALKRTMRLV